MRRILVLTVFAVMAMLCTAALGAANPPGFAAMATHVTAVRGGEDGGDGHEVSRAQYRILIAQCQYAESASARAQCRSDVASTYRVGEPDPALDCRTFSSVTVCGELKLGKRELGCVEESVNGGQTYRRAEVECYAFR